MLGVNDVHEFMEKRTGDSTSSPPQASWKRNVQVLKSWTKSAWETLYSVDSRCALRFVPFLQSQTHLSVLRGLQVVSFCSLRQGVQLTV